MREIALLLNDMVADGVVTNYALFGAVAQIRYTSPVATLDADVLVEIPSSGGLDVLSSGEAIRVGEWPLQFIPAFSPLTREAMERAETADFDGVPLRVVRADHLAAIALSVGRPKDYARILALLESETVTREAITSLAESHGLKDAWARFEKKFLTD